MSSGNVNGRLAQGGPSEKTRSNKTRAAETLKRQAQRQPGALVHWSMGYLS
jgi:hypothetical protein